MEQKDWIMRQVEGVSSSIAQVMFNKERATYEIVLPGQQAENDLLYKQLMELLAKSKINEAENLLFEFIDVLDNDYYLQIALDFYFKLSEYDDEYLEACNFYREEIEEGLIQIKKLLNIN